VLSAIGCHTTLKANAGLLDKVVFVADKMKWDQVGDPPYCDAINAALVHGIDRAAWCYLQYLWEMRERLPVIHPWFMDAYRQMAAQFG
jgi:HD superfamily phosphohydrolase YqeK